MSDLLYSLGTKHTGSIKDSVLNIAECDTHDVERSGKSDYDKEQHRGRTEDSPASPKPRQQQCDQRRRREPPVIQDLDVVPDPGRHLKKIWHDEAERKRQVEKQQSFPN